MATQQQLDDVVLKLKDVLHDLKALRPSEVDPPSDNPPSGNPVQTLLDLIAQPESGGNYNAIWGDASSKDPLLVEMSLDAILAWQRKRIATIGKSACGRYQYIRRTLKGLIKRHKIDRSRLYDEAMQDELAMHSLRARGLTAFLAGDGTAEDFANCLAMEWAGLPVVSMVQGAYRWVKPGMSYYAGDGLNKAHIGVDEVLNVLRGLRS